MLKRATAFLDYSIDTTCPHCNKDIDIVEMESNSGDHEISNKVFNNQWSSLEGWTVTCPHCDLDFELEKLEY